jgi:hypothetical protein
VLTVPSNTFCRSNGGGGTAEDLKNYKTTFAQQQQQQQQKGGGGGGGVKKESLFNVWHQILNHQFLDSVVFSLLQNAKGMTCRDATHVIVRRIRRRNPPALSSSLIEVILEKLDEEDDESCFSKKLNGERFFSLGIQLVRNAVSQDSKDLSKTFFIDNSQLVKRVFGKGRGFGDLEIETAIDLTIDEIEECNPQTTGMF